MAESFVIRPTVTVSASPDYAAGDAINTGAIELPNIPYEIVRLLGINLRDAANQGPALYLLFFSENPSSSTITDNAAFVLHASDINKVCGIFEVLAADYITVDSKKFVDYGDIGLGLTRVGTSSNKSIWLVIVANGAYNAAATTDLRIDFEFEREAT